MSDPMTLGVTLAVLGMGGTLLTLFLLSLVIDLLKRLFPVPPEPNPATDRAGPHPNPPPPGGMDRDAAPAPTAPAVGEKR